MTLHTPLAGFVSPNLLHVLKRQVGLESSCSVAKAVKSPEGRSKKKRVPQRECEDVDRQENQILLSNCSPCKEVVKKTRAGVLSATQELGKR